MNVKELVRNGYWVILKHFFQKNDRFYLFRSKAHFCFRMTQFRLKSQKIAYFLIQCSFARRKCSIRELNHTVTLYKIQSLTKCILFKSERDLKPDVNIEICLKSEKLSPIHSNCLLYNHLQCSQMRVIFPFPY